jgi:hypothetical protein
MAVELYSGTTGASFRRPLAIHPVSFPHVGGSGDAREGEVALHDALEELEKLRKKLSWLPKLLDQKRIDEAQTLLQQTADAITEVQLAIERDLGVRMSQKIKRPPPKK